MSKDLVIGNIAGFDVAAMSQLTEKQFVELHKDNADMSYGKTPAEFDAWLKDAYKQIKAAAGPAPKQKEDAADEGAK